MKRTQSEMKQDKLNQVIKGGEQFGMFLAAIFLLQVVFAIGAFCSGWYTAAFDTTLAAIAVLIIMRWIAKEVKRIEKKHTRVSQSGKPFHDFYNHPNQ